MALHKMKGLVLALSSSFSIGASSVVKKMGLKKDAAFGIREVYCPIHDKNLDPEALIWYVYERWLSRHGITRDLNEKNKRFKFFRARVENFSIDFKLGIRPGLGLDRFADLDFYEATYYECVAFLNYRMLEQPPLVQVRSQWVERINQIRTKQLESLPKQEIIDRDKKVNKGCNGGLNTFEYVEQNGGITTEQNYPFGAQNSTCDASRENSHSMRIDGHENVFANDENALMKVVTNQLGSVAISYFQLQYEKKKNPHEEDILWWRAQQLQEAVEDPEWDIELLLPW